MTHINLRSPGPTPVPDAVAAAGARPMVSHRGGEFATTMSEIVERLRPFFGTEGDIMVLTGSGTGGQEAAIVNLLSPGDEVLAVGGGLFGLRFGEMARTFGMTVHPLEVEWGRACSVAAIQAAIEQHPGLRAVLLVHNESSTGVAHDLGSLVPAIRRVNSDLLVLVDGISSLGGLPFRMDDWDVDAVVTASQKAWMTPPGLAMIALSDRAWRAYEDARLPRYYWDLGRARREIEKGSTPYTPAVSVVYSLHRALQLMIEEGVDAVFERHCRLARRVRSGVEALGLSLFADPAAASDTITTVRLPADAPDLVERLRERHGVVVGNGMERLRGVTCRIGHMGHVHDEDIDHLLMALEAEVRAAVEAPV